MPFVPTFEPTAQTGTSIIAAATNNKPEELNELLTPNIMSTKHTIGVLDMTFQDIFEEEQFSSNLAKAMETQVNSPSKTSSSSTTSPSPPSHTGTIAGGEEGGDRSGSPGRRKKKKEEVKALRISNNRINQLDIICGPMSATLDTSKILWLDLSFNQIKRLGTLAATFPNVTTIYLHANQISRLSELKKLSEFTQLKSLALYGNPVEEHRHYRNYVLYACPNLTQFDMSPVTKSERQTVWLVGFREFCVEAFV